MNVQVESEEQYGIVHLLYTTIHHTNTTYLSYIIYYIHFHRHDTCLEFFLERVDTNSLGSIKNLIRG